MSWDNNAPIRFQLGTIALWNLFFKRGTIDGNNPALNVIKDSLVGARQFEDLTKAPLPVSMEAKHGR
jgi:hypothetical protein